MNRSEFKQRMQSLKSYRENNPGKGYWDWRNSLPDNLKYTNDLEYDMRGAYESGAQPKLEDDGLYHLPSRDPKSGRILKSSAHPTYWKALEYDSKIGYKPYFMGDRTYTWNNEDGPFIPWQQIEAFEGGGILLPEIEVLGTYPRKQRVYDRANSSQANFIQRVKDINRNTIPDWETHNAVATHKLSYAEDRGKYIVYPDVQEINGNLYDFTDPKNGHYHDGKYRWTDALDSAINRGDTLTFDRESDAKYFTEHYKEYYPSFKEGGGTKIGTTRTDYYGNQTHYLPVKQYGLFVRSYEGGGEIPPELYERSDYQGSNEPVYVNPFTGKPLANGAITPAFNLEDFANFTPAGDVLSVRDAFIAAKNKDLIGLGLAGLGFIPFVRGVGRRTINRPVPTVDRSYFDRQYEQMERERARRLQTVDDYYNQSDAVYESLIENEDAFRRAVNADATANTDYVKTYTDMLRGYRGNTSRNNDALPQMHLTDNIPYDAKAQVDPGNLDWIRINRRYSDPNELDPTFQKMNPGLVRHELGHIVDERSGLNYTNTLSDPSKFESEERLKEMYPKTYKRLQNEVLNRGSEIKSYMNEFRDYLMNKGLYNPNETTKSFRQKLDEYGEGFPVLKKIFDSYKSKKQFIKDYNSVPIVQNNQRSNKSNYA